MNKLTGLFIGMAVTVGCGTDFVPDPPALPSGGPETLPNLVVPPAPLPGQGWQVITPIVDNLQPGSDTEMCTWTDIYADSESPSQLYRDVRSTLSTQTQPPGHHVVVYYTTVNQPAGTSRVCNDADMASFRFLAGSGGEGTANTAPGDLVYRLPQGAQVVINHHYLNSTDQVLSGQSVVNINFADPNDGPYTPSGNTAFVDTSLVVQMGPNAANPAIPTDDIHCVIPTTGPTAKPMKLWYFIPHMHQWGQHIDIYLTQSGVKTQVVDQDWDPSFAFSPPDPFYADLTQPLNSPTGPKVLNPGDEVDVHCEWNNDSGMVLPFGFEMCVAFGEFVDDQNEGSWACDGGNWTSF